MDYSIQHINGDEIRTATGRKKSARSPKVSESLREELCSEHRIQISKMSTRAPT